MAHDEPAASGAKIKLAIKNVGLMLSGDLKKPILDADSIVAVDGGITAIRRASDLDLSGAPTTVGAHGGAPVRSPAIGRRGRASSTGSIPACMAASRRWCRRAKFTRPVGRATSSAS